MKIGYSFWGFIANDYFANLSPDGGLVYRAALIKELMKSGHKIYTLQKDRDHANPDKFSITTAFERKTRKKAYESVESQNYYDMILKTNNFPEIDLLFVEWRWKIPGRNCDIEGWVEGDWKGNIDRCLSNPSYTQDYDTQMLLMDYYKDRCPIVVWDLDYKLTTKDQINYNIPNNRVLDLGYKKRLDGEIGTHVHVPLDISIFKGREEYYPIDELLDKTMLVSYVGNNYERSTVIERYIKPVSDAFNNKVHFFGNWQKYEKEHERLLNEWPNIVLHSRISYKDFPYALGRSLTSPLLAKEDYLQDGFMTGRIYEILYFNCLPIGLGEMKNIENYVLPELIVQDGKDYVRLINELQKLSYNARKDLYAKQISSKYMEQFDVRYFVKTLENLI